jgi:hypothetical protein
MRLAAFAAVLVAPLGAARADTLDFSYTFANNDVLAGVLGGTDAGNYFTVTSVLALTFNGMDVSGVIAGATPESYDSAASVGLGYNGNGTGVVTLDGSYMDLIDSPTGQYGFGFALGDEISARILGGTGAAAFVATNPDVDDIDHPFVQANWSAELIPEPGSVTLLVSALGLLGLARRRA